ncbi:Eco57I restriction-modification methylase domain-containing protein [Leptolyngbya sp. BL0902]|uniref:Eco57I restriction-modification methylase domain-containing protein n=1 Tax=Leptolyngbya sp. BL0902 TaxID=1115757 RepID=UPI0018E8937E|nr:Eco57I restriction-modification methylase domain-containing protein [Leptolyngbya sp. BL0902]
MPQSSHHRLFQEKTLSRALKGFTFPDDITTRHQTMLQWVKALESGTLDAVKETSLHGEFLQKVFQEVLGYRSVVGGAGQQWELHAEQTISDGGGSADGALGFFHAVTNQKGGKKLEGRVIAPIELKGAKNDLDRAAPGRKESAVDQGWRYANYTADCRWVLVSNYREIRLYQTSKTPAYYEVFRLKDLTDITTFKAFYFVLCRQNFLPPSADPKARSVIDQLLVESDKAEVEITKALYEEYKQVRINLARHFRATGPADLPDRDIALIEKAQKTLDRVLFIAFCEDKDLLPKETLQQAHDHQDPYNPRLIWENYKAVFRAVDQGNPSLAILGYNGGLFKYDPLLDDQLQVSDILCTQLKKLARYDFESEVSVNILGHIFEQSVTDLEELRALAAGETYDQKKGQRKTQGVYYTPAFITQYIVSVALGGYLHRKEKALWQEIGIDQIRANAVRQRRKAEIQFWERYRDEVLVKTRVVDPACGSGAFLIAAFDYLNNEYERVNEQLAALKLADDTGEFLGQRSLFDLTKTILNQNLYGVDLSSESVEITKLSLWLKTAERGKQLTYLDDNIKVGNSIVDDPTVAPRAFAWATEFAEVFADGGFDVVIGNPPYVRQELLTPFKPYLQRHYAAYDGVADLYVYFYEKGLKILRPNGVMSYIVTNKWLRAGYGEPLRKFFAENSIFEQIIDFGHAPIFQDADVFPCIVAVRKPVEEDIQKSDTSISVEVCPIPREKLENINLPQFVNQEGYKISWDRFYGEAWSLELPEVGYLFERIQRTESNLKDFVGIKPYRGILTGFNDAFLIDDSTRKSLIEADEKCSEIIKPYLRGQDVDRWSSEWEQLWMIFIRWDCSIEEYPSVLNWLETHRKGLSSRPEVIQRRFPWYAMSRYGSDYWELYEKPKIIYQEIQFHPSYSFDLNGQFTNNKVFFISTDDLYLLATLNSPLMWWYNWRYLPHMKDEALTPKGELIELLPIAPPTDEIRAEVEPAVQQLIELTKANQQATREMLDWFRVEHGIDKAGNKLSDFATLSLDDFLQEIKKRRPKGAGNLGPKDLKTLKEAYGDYALPIQQRRRDGLVLEHRISDLVNQAYDLTPEDIDLMWKTAPPRMPFSRP